MIEKSNKFRIIYVFSFSFIFVMLCSIVNYYVATLLGGYFIGVLYFFSLVMLVFKLNLRIKKEKSLLFGILFLVVYGLNAVVSTISGLFYGFVFFAPITLICLLSYQDPNYEKLCFHVNTFAIVSLFITTVLSVRILMTNPGACRVMGSASFGQYGFDRYFKQGLVGFGVLYGILLAIPAVFLCAKRQTNKAMKFALYLLFVLMIYVIVTSGYATAVLLLFVEAILLFVIRADNKLLSVIMIIIVGFAFLFFREYISQLLLSFADNTGSRALSGHLVEVAGILSGNSSNSAEDLDRIQLIRKSIDAFFDNPLFGTNMFPNRKHIGGHSQFFDILGGNGLIGITTYMLMWISFYNRIRTRIRDSECRSMWSIISIVFFVLQLINPIINNYQIVFVYMLVVPCMLIKSQSYDRNRFD